MPGHVTRKGGRIVDFPDRVRKSFRWLSGISLSMPILMLLIGFGSPRWVFPTWGGILLAVLPFGLVITALVGMFRKGQGGILAFAAMITLMHYFAMTTQPLTNGYDEMLMTRLTPILGVVAILYFLREDLRYNLRPFWYSMQAMKELQESMMKMRAKRDAKKRGETYDESKVMDADAIVRAVQAQTGREVPKSMSGFNAKPGFRQESNKGKSAGTSSKQRKKRR